jgi:hypothetical protein
MLTENRRHEGIWDELQIVVTNSRIKEYQIKWLRHLGRMEQNCSQPPDPEGESNKAVHVTEGEKTVLHLMVIILNVEARGGLWESLTFPAATADKVTIHK